MPQLPYGPGTPLPVAAGEMTVDWFLKNPTVITKVLDAVPSQYFIGDLIFRKSRADAGVIIYDRVTQLDLFVNAEPGRQPGNVEPGSAFAQVDVDEAVPNIALVQTSGAFFNVTDEQERRDNRDVVAIKLRKLINTMIRVSDAKAVNKLFSDPLIAAQQTAPAAAYWDSGTTQLRDLQAAIGRVDYNEMGYSVDTALCHPDAFEALQGADKVQAWMAREKRPDNPLFNKQIDGFKGLNWVITRRAPRTSVALFHRGMVGVRGEEIPPATEVIPERKYRRTRIQHSRVETFAINEPMSVSVISNVIA